MTHTITTMSATPLKLIASGTLLWEMSQRVSYCLLQRPALDLTSHELDHLPSLHLEVIEGEAL